MLAMTASSAAATVIASIACCGAAESGSASAAPASAAALLMVAPDGNTRVRDVGTWPSAVASHHCVTGTGTAPWLTRYASSVDRSITSPAPVMVGNALATATIFAGTVVRLTVVWTMLPTPVLLARSNAVVAMAGTAAGTMFGAESVICAASGSVWTGDAPGACDHRPYPGTNVSVAPPGARCHPAACGPADGPYMSLVESSEASSGELATAVHVPGAAPAMVSVTGVFSRFAGSV
jgi:hypothetical protein